MNKARTWIFGGLALLAMPFVALLYTKILAPEYETVRRDVYEGSLSYNRGKVEHLNRLCFQLRTAESEGHRTALSATIRTEASTYEFDRLPNDLQGCVRQAENPE